MSTANSSAMSVSTIQSNDSEPIYLRDVREVKLPDHVEYEIPEGSMNLDFFKCSLELRSYNNIFYRFS